MDPQSSESFDAHYFTALKQHKGLFQSDASLLTDPASAKIVDSLLKPDSFFSEFGKSMKNMGQIELLTGSAGEIRTNCRVVNAWGFTQAYLIKAIVIVFQFGFH